MNDKKFNGHKSWGHWNVALWISNDEPLYRLACGALRRSRGDVQAAAAELVECLPASTPDGAPYTHETIAAAMEAWS